MTVSGAEQQVSLEGRDASGPESERRQDTPFQDA